MGKLQVKEFTKWVKEQVGNAYLWGGQGESVYELVRKLAKKNGQSDERTDKMLKYMNKMGAKDIKFFDCSGLSIYYLMKNNAISYDTTASGLYKLCSPINDSQVVEGDWCFLKNANGDIYHIGYVVDNEKIVHSLNQEKGVIIENRASRKWIYARPDFAFDFTKPQKPQIDTLEVGYKVTLTESIKGYNTADNALKRRNPTVTYPSGEYYVYRVYNGAVNITKSNGKPGAWVVL